MRIRRSAEEGRKDAAKDVGAGGLDDEDLGVPRRGIDVNIRDNL